MWPVDILGILVLKHVITLIGDVNVAIISPEITESARSALAALGAAVGDVDWLSEGRACDLPIDGVDPDSAVACVSAATVGYPIDVVGCSRAHRRKKLLVADMDSTIIQQECIDEVADYVGRREEVSAITERAMRGEIDFPEAVRARAGMFSGLEATMLKRAYDERITLTPGAESLVRTMRKDGASTALVSGGFTHFTSRVAARVGFDHHHGDELEIENGRLTGKAIEPIMGGDAKVRMLDHYQSELGISREETMAVGDGANDIPMIKASGLGVAFHGKPRVVAAADARIEHTDLTALLYIQGFREYEIGR